MININGKLIHKQGDPNTFGSTHGPGLPFIRANGIPIAVQGQLSTGHGSFPPSPSIQGAPNIRANGFGVMSFGDAYASHTDGTSVDVDTAAPVN